MPNEKKGEQKGKKLLAEKSAFVLTDKGEKKG